MLHTGADNKKICEMGGANRIDLAKEHGLNCVHIKPCMLLKDIIAEKEGNIPFIQFQNFVYEIITNPIETRNNYYNKILQIQGVVGGLEIKSNRDFLFFYHTLSPIDFMFSIVLISVM
jgi:hypothetical protein